MNKKTLATILYFIDKRGGATVTELMKLAYLADLIVSKGDVKRKITDFDYVRWHYGPFDKSIYSCLERLSKNDLIDSKIDYTVQGSEAITYVSKGRLNSSEGLTEGERQSLDNLLSQVGGLGPVGLTKLAYATYPLKRMGVKIGDNKKIGEKIVFSLSK